MAGETGFIKYLTYRFGKIILLVFAIAIVFWVYNKIESKKSTQGKSQTQEIKDKILQSNIIYTKHALCRMECRNISKEDILEVLRNGELNHSKTTSNDSQCPTYAIEAKTKSYNKVLAIFAICDDVSKLVTTYPVRVEDPDSCKKCEPEK